MRLSSGRRFYGLSGAPPYRSIYKLNHSGEGGLLATICNVHGGVENYGDDPDGALVGSRLGKRAGGTNKEEVYLINLT